MELIKNLKWLLLLVVIGLVLLNLLSTDPQLERLPSNASVLALGDSLTYGTGVDKHNSYPAVLQNLSGLNVINAGIPGETSAGTLSRVKQELQKHQPDLVILCIGGNDILRRHNKKEIVSNIQQLIDIIKQHDSQLVMLAVPEFGLYPTAPDFYQELADKNGIPLDNETIPSMLRDSSLKSDAIHGNEAGYRVIAEGVYELLRESGVVAGE